MTTYVMLTKWTEKGMVNVKESPKRLDAAKKALRDMGGEFKSVYMTMGDYDLVAVYEAPDDAIAARFTLILGMLGNVRTTTLKACATLPDGTAPSKEGHQAAVNFLGLAPWSNMDERLTRNDAIDGIPTDIGRSRFR